MKKALFCIWSMCLLFFLVIFDTVDVEAASNKEIIIGQTISLYKEGAKYSSSDTSIAYVDSNGTVFGKKTGEVIIKVKTQEKKKKVKVTVKANKKKPAQKLSIGEINVSGIQMTCQEKPEGGYTYYAIATVENKGAKKAKSVEVVGRIGDADVSFVINGLESGAVGRAEMSGEIALYQDTVEIQQVSLYSMSMVQRHSYIDGSYSYDYATEDTTAPEITGFVGKDSYNGKITYRVKYSDDDNFDYFKYVKATDDRNTKVDLTVDTSEVDFEKTGTYVITYIATDKAGNTTKKKARLGIRVVDSLDKMCDTVLKKITEKNWSDQKKATAIYNYVRGHVTYTGNSDKSSWEKEAANGLRYGRGDCFTYYALSRALLTRAGIPNIEVRRVKGSGDHWWGKVYVEDGFYHFDTCPRTGGGRFCLLTDEQLSSYSRNYGNSHIWAYKKKPKSGTKHFSDVF